jgi:lipid A ethanolaminephosphotransferase
MRVGMQPRDLPDLKRTWARRPTMWDYAKAAGFKTVLVDGMVPPAPVLHSYMDRSEARAIDRTITFPTMPFLLRDHAVANAISDLLDEDEPLFIAVNKKGVHAPYDEVVPADMTYDPEALVSGLPLDPSRRAIVKDYHKALRWSVDAFFEKLMPKLVREDTLTIYTSDHGQSMFEGGYDQTHCTIGENVAAGESYVPLFAIAGLEWFQAALQKAAARAIDHASHFEIFPTLLVGMGYDEGWVSNAYGPTLLNVPTRRERGFVMGTFFLPGAKWIKVDNAAQSAEPGHSTVAQSRP